MLDGQRHGAGAAARIQHPGGLVIGQPVQDRVHQQFRFRSRHQRGGRNGQRKGIKLPAPGQVGHGHASRAPFDKLSVSGGLRGGYATLRKTDKKAPGAVEGERQQQFRVEPRTAARWGKPRSRPVKQRADRTCAGRRNSQRSGGRCRHRGTGQSPITYRY